jgi:hypothetical protein
MGRDGVWRIQPTTGQPGCYDLRHHGGLVLQRVSVDVIVRYLVEQGVDIGDLVED